MVDDVSLSYEARDEGTVARVPDSIVDPRVAKIRARHAVSQQKM
jgi:hypothetical protein